jgi:DNA repair protein SbcD/Mre11
VVRILHAADLHIDSQVRVRASRASEGFRERISGATRAAFHALIDVAVSERVDAVILAGDIFDGRWRSYATRGVFIDGMGRLHDEGIPVVMASGNHDAASVLAVDLRLPPTAHQLSVHAPESFHVPNTDLVVHGQGYEEPAITENLARAYPRSIPGHINIGVLHTNVGGSTDHDNYAPCSPADLRALGYDYFALGHIHQRQEYLDSGAVYAAYPGNIQGRHIRETGAKGASVVTLEPGIAPTIEFHPLDVMRWSHLNIDARTHETPDAILSEISHQYAAEHRRSDGRPLIIRVTIQLPPDGYSTLLRHRDFHDAVEDTLRGATFEGLRTSVVSVQKSHLHEESLLSAISAAGSELSTAQVEDLLSSLRDDTWRALQDTDVRLSDSAYLDDLTQQAIEELQARMRAGR